MADHAIITGAPKVVDPNNPGIGPQPQPRFNIYDFVKNEKHFSLYIQALNRMYAMNQDDDPSHFAIGGIHGLPYRPWASADNDPNPDTQWGGYCTHGTVLFPTWHRPYVAGYEQFIQKNALEIAQSYNDPTWTDAAQRLRVPYWDWAAQGQAVPPEEIINMPQVTITTPKGQESVTNPFWGYTFHPIDPSFDYPFSGWRKTLRRPASGSPNARDDPAAVKSVLNRRAFTTTKNTYKLFSIRDWDHFSNHTTSNNSGTNSLESVHDNIHGSVGGGGHMGDPRYAGLDPIFFLHHCNVDRVLALWQAVNYDVPITSGNSENGTWTEAADVTIGPDTPLTPFWNTDSTFWNSTVTASGVNDFTVFGYTYPEFQGLDLSDKEAVREAISKQVTRLYGPQPIRPRSEGVQAAMAMPSASRAGGTVSAQSLNYDREWSTRITCDQFEIGKSFTVYAFLGEAPEDPEKWEEAPSSVGSHSFFVNKDPSRCENCQKQAGGRVEGFIHLSNTLLDRDDIDDPALKVDKIEPYLQEKGLSIRICTLDGNVIDPTQLKTFEAQVISTPLHEDSRAHHPLPTLGQVRQHFSVLGPQP